ncbi:MAG: S-layer homology domain-containing protein [Candidatus Peribacteraceae bacterium]|nr:S-layer homology domain-containing protein [Candidatus Peribacteraceae bacterium]
MEKYKYFLQRKVWTYLSVSLLCSVLGIAGAEAASFYWVGGVQNSTQFEEPTNWSSVQRGAPGSAAPGSADTAVMSFSGTTVQMRSDVNVKGMILNEVWTGSVLLGTGSITVGTSGIRMGSGRLIGPETNNIALNGDFTQTGGIVRIGDYMLTLSGSMAISADAVFVSTGTVVFDGTTQTLDTSNNPLTNLTVGSTTSLTLTSDQSITGTLQIDTGATLDLDSYTIYATGATIINYGTLTENTGKIEHTATNVLMTDVDFAAEKTSFVPGDYVSLTVTDSDENIDGTALDTITGSLVIGSDMETVTLTETSKTSGIFRGSIQIWGSTNVVPASQNGYLELTAAGTMTFTYTDQQDAGANNDEASVTVTTASTTTTTSTGGGGGRRGGGETTTVSASNEAVGGAAESALPQVGGHLQVSIEGKSVVLKDVPVSEWFAMYVDALVAEGIVSGYKDARGNLTGEFKPGNNVTFAEIAKMAVEAAGLELSSNSPKNRSAKGQWSAGYIAALEERGVSLFADPSLDVNAPAPRGAVLQIVLEAFGQTIPAAQGGVYSDVSAGTAHAGAIEASTLTGIVSGDDGKTTFRPNAPINRAETAKIIKNSMSVFGQ